MRIAVNGEEEICRCLRVFC